MTAPGQRGRVRGEEGQATVELALTLPLLVVLGLVVVQVGLVARDAVLVTHAARAGAREAAVDARPGEVRRAALLAAPALKSERVSTETSHQGGSPDIVTVRVRYRSPTVVPLVGPVFPAVEIVGKAAIQDETAHAPQQVRHGAQKTGRNRVMNRGTLRQ